MVEKTCNFNSNCVYIYADKTVNKMFDIDLFFIYLAKKNNLLILFSYKTE